MENEEYQKVLEKNSRMKKEISGHQYFGDKACQILYRLMRKHLKEPVLDVGAGTGALVRAMQRKGYRAVTGIDLYPKADFIKKGMITDIPYSDSTFNTVICTEVIEHLTTRQIDNGLNEVRRVLRQNGKLIISVPYNENLEESKFTCPHCRKRFHKVGHLQSFSKARMKNILEDKGFRIISMRIYALGAMAKLPLGARLNWLFLKMDYEAISKSLVVVCKR